MCNNNNNLIIEIQPKQNFHFRYADETSHGFLNGQLLNEKLDKNDVVYPTVKLLLPQNENLNEFNKPREFYILCTLHNSNVMCLSPHVLKPQETDFNYEFIFQKMYENELKPLEKLWQLQEYIIVRVKKDDYKTALETKRAEYLKLKLPLSFETIKGNVNINKKESVKKSAGLNVCLGFTVFEKVDETFRLFNETIYSHNIYDGDKGDDLKIHRLCNEEGSINGGELITILIYSKLPLNVLITKKNDTTDETEWSKEIEIEKKNNFGNHAISFKLPPYDGPSCSDKRILVHMQVVVRKSIYKSNKEAFYYVNHNVRQRKVPQSSTPTQQESVVVPTSPSISDNAANDIILLDNNLLDDLSHNDFNNDHFHNLVDNMDNFLFPSNPNVSKDRMLTLHQKQIVPEKAEHSKSTVYPFNNEINIMPNGKKDDNKIFHEAIRQLTKLLNESPHKKDILEVRNKFRENLLHYSCKYNRSTFIRPLIAMGCRLYEQDSEGRTPLHTAIEFKQHDCVLQIQQLLEDHSEYPQEVKEQLIKMFQVYNHGGLTVLHAAVVNNRVKLFQIMLKFCQKYNINVEVYKVSGHDVPLEHLIYFKLNLIAVIKLIQRYIPAYFKIENYFLKLIPLYWPRLYQIHQRK